LALANGIGELLQKIFDAELEGLEVEVVRFSKGVNPYVFFVGHQLCALDISFPCDKLAVSFLIDANAKGHNSTSKLIEEHIALQFSGVLKEIVFKNKDVPVIFQGLGKEGSFLDLDCISLQLNMNKKTEKLVCRFNIFIPPKLILEDDVVNRINLPVALNGLMERVSGKKEIKINIYLGVLHLPPSSLVDLLAPKNRIKLPDDFSLKECILNLDEDTSFSGALMKNGLDNAFIIGERIQERFFDYKSGYSSVYLRVYTGDIANQDLAINFPYLHLASNWEGEIELLIGGEFVSRGVLEYGDEGLFVKVC